jgi:hypothetical protein
MRLTLVSLVLLAALSLTATAPGAKSRVKTISAKLTAAAVAPKSTSTSTGTVSVTLDAKAGKACWKISVKTAIKPFSAHIHRGVLGKNGPVVIPLGDVWKPSGCVEAPAKSIAAVAATPKNYYVDVHSPKHIDGLVRGQLHSG